MPSTAKKLLDEAMALSPEERRRLGAALLESAQEPAVDLGPAWREEIADRLQRIARGDAELQDATLHLAGLRAHLAGE